MLTQFPDVIKMAKFWGNFLLLLIWLLVLYHESFKNHCKQHCCMTSLEGIMAARNRCRRMTSSDSWGSRLETFLLQLSRKKSRESPIFIYSFEKKKREIFLFKLSRFKEKEAHTTLSAWRRRLSPIFSRLSGFDLFSFFFLLIAELEKDQSTLTVRRHCLSYWNGYIFSNDSVILSPQTLFIFFFETFSIHLTGQGQTRIDANRRWCFKQNGRLFNKKKNETNKT